MSEEISKEYVGKYVCHQRIDGGACWGKIKDQGFINTMDGEKEMVILTDRYVRYVDPYKRNRFFGVPTNAIESENGIFLVKSIPGDSILRLDVIDVEKDIIDIGDLADLVDNETLFKALSLTKYDNRGITFDKSGGDVFGVSAIEIGLKQMIANDEDFKNNTSKSLMKRLFEDG